MKKTIFFLFVLSIFLIISLNFPVHAQREHLREEKRTEWKSASSRGFESTILEPVILSKTSQITDLCVFAKKDIDLSKLPPQIIVRDRQGNIIFTFQKKFINGRFGYCGEVDGAVHNYLRFGRDSIIFVYGDSVVLEMQDSEFNTTVDMEFFKNVSDLWENVFTDMKIQDITEGFKFYSNDTYSNETEVNQYKLIFNSSELAFAHDDKGYYFSKIAYVNESNGFVRQIETRRDFISNDICSNILYKSGNKTKNLGSANCTFSLSNNDKILEIIFNRNYFLDPTITISDVSSYVSTKINITAENNFTHLTIGNISTGAINNTNLILYMPFDTNTSTTRVYDYSSNNNDGTITGNAYYNKSGIFGGAFVFDSKDDYLSVPSSASVNFIASRNYTWMAWVYPVSTGSAGSSGAGIFHKCDESSSGISIWLDDSRRLNVDDCVPPFTSVFSTATVTLNRWNHIAVNYTNGKFTFFFNGQADTTGSITFTDDTLSVLAIGKGFNSGLIATNFFNGSIDEVMIVNVSLNQTQINFIYQNQSSRFFPRGEQIFKSLEEVLSIGDPIGNKLNITINSSTNFSSVINVSVGNQSGDDYVYYPEVAFTNNFANNTDFGTTTNFSLKFIFYAGNMSTNPFITPTLEYNITIATFKDTSCNYNSGHWNIRCSDNCSISKNITIDNGYNITLTQAGTFTIQDGAFVTRWQYLYSQDTCQIIGKGSGGFR